MNLLAQTAAASPPWTTTVIAVLGGLVLILGYFHQFVMPAILAAISDAKSAAAAANATAQAAHTLAVSNAAAMAVQPSVVQPKFSLNHQAVADSLQPAITAAVAQAVKSLPNWPAPSPKIPPNLPKATQ